MDRKEFFEQYKDPRWQKKRLKIMERDEFMCQSCFDSEATLNVHHKYYIYDKKPWEYSDSLLITLCQSCHEWEEENKSIQSDFAKILLSDGYTNSQLTTLLEWLRRLPSGDHGISYVMDAVRAYETRKTNG